MRKRILIALVGVLIILSLAGCEKDAQPGKSEQNEVKKEEEQKSDAENSENVKDNLNNETDKGEEEANRGEEHRISIYVPNGETGELEILEVEIEKVDPQNVWKELQNVGIISEEEEILGVEENVDDKTMILNLNKAFGEHLRGLGTTGESELINSIVNTYLEVFQCEKIKLMEEGGKLVSGHKEYDEYMGRK